VRNGDQVTVTGHVVLGSTSTVGTGSYTFSLPFSNAGAGKNIGSAIFQHTGVTNYPSICRLLTGASTVDILISATGATLGAASPAVPASTDEVHYTVTYEIAKSA
jgi:hypothetical protein